MKTYLVGGAVRDLLMGKTHKDKDYVVVGSTPEELIEKGFKRVGAEFPVFLHPETHEEYALARTERKAASWVSRVSYQFHPGITLEEDLGRRDLTINAMAMDEEGHVIDPFGGQEDLRIGILRHVNEEAFKEDPIRVLRIARFFARYKDFAVHYDTQRVCEEIAESGALDNLTAERVWKELENGLMEDHPSKMFDLLWGVSALEVILPELAELVRKIERVSKNFNTDLLTETLWSVNRAADNKAPVEVRFALLMQSLEKEQISAICDRLKVPNDCKDLALMLNGLISAGIRDAEMLPAERLLDMLSGADAIRRPERFVKALMAHECILKRPTYNYSRNYEEYFHKPSEVMRLALQAAASVDCGAIAKACSDPKQIADRIREARIEKINNAMRLI